MWVSNLNGVWATYIDYKCSKQHVDWTVIIMQRDATWISRDSLLNERTMFEKMGRSAARLFLCTLLLDSSPHSDNNYLLSSHLISSHLTSPHLSPPHCRLIRLHLIHSFITPHFISSHHFFSTSYLISSLLISFHLILSLLFLILSQPNSSHLNAVSSHLIWSDLISR